MWPTAMLTYKTVNRLRLFTMNKIISFEPCVEKTALYGLSKLPKAGCNGNGHLGGRGSGDASSGEMNYVIMLDGDKNKEKGIWHQQDERSAVSSLSGEKSSRRIV